ncbi:MAG: hypothetical protein M3O87_06360 [Candidatus Dormibacteraeota bacterium]|nr:hypothetical protein [Candidatus Dormibacteraeota bacterium]
MSKAQRTATLTAAHEHAQQTDKSAPWYAAMAIAAVALIDVGVELLEAVLEDERRK